MSLKVRALTLAAIALALWSCPSHAFCEPTEEEIAAARVRIEAREASGTAPTGPFIWKGGIRMSYDVAMVMDADNIRKRRAAVRFRLRPSQFPQVVADDSKHKDEFLPGSQLCTGARCSGLGRMITSSTMLTFPVFVVRSVVRSISF